MPESAQIVAVAVAMVATYLVCGIPFGLIVAARAAGVDVRTSGSGNIGTTNVARTAGKGAAGLTLLLDVGKGFLCITIARIAFSRIFAGGDAQALGAGEALGYMLSWVYLATIVGHVYSCYLGFHGGKGIAVGLGGSLAFIPLSGLLALAGFAIVVALTHYVSAGSLTAAGTITIWTALLYTTDVSFLMPVAIVSAIVIWAHRANIMRLAHGEESRFRFKGRGEGE